MSADMINNSLTLSMCLEQNTWETTKLYLLIGRIPKLWEYRKQ